MRSMSEECKCRILEYIDEYFEENYHTPTLIEIAAAVGMSKSAVANYLNRMEAEGRLNRNRRAVVTEKIGKQHEQTKAPLLGTIACGTPIFAEENIECYFSIPEQFIGKGKFFFLRTSGDSMINAGIDDGDLVLLRQQEVAEDGEIVCALIGDEATLKRYRKDNRRRKIVLIAENDDKTRYPDIVPKEEVRLQGVMVGIFRIKRKMLK